MFNGRNALFNSSLILFNGRKVFVNREVELRGIGWLFFMTSRQEIHYHIIDLCNFNDIDNLQVRDEYGIENSTVKEAENLNIYLCISIWNDFQNSSSPMKIVAGV